MHGALRLRLALFLASGDDDLSILGFGRKFLAVVVIGVIGNVRRLWMFLTHVSTHAVKQVPSAKASLSSECTLATEMAIAAVAYNAPLAQQKYSPSLRLLSSRDESALSRNQRSQ